VEPHSDVDPSEPDLSEPLAVELHSDVGPSEPDLSEPAVEPTAVEMHSAFDPSEPEFLEQQYTVFQKVTVEIQSNFKYNGTLTPLPALRCLISCAGLSSKTLFICSHKFAMAQESGTAG
jgi:hypothetical protein